jgi:hypothetical protein
MVQRLKILTIVAVSAFAGAYATDYINNLKFETNAQLLQQKTDSLNTKIAELQQENAQLALRLNNKKFTATTTAVASFKAQPPTSVQTQPTEQSNEPAPVNQLQDGQLLHASENFNSWLVTGHKERGSFNLHDEMQRRFDAESVDHDWAEAQEQEYLTLFSQSPELAGLALRETQCRTRQCALTISISDINQANELLEKMTKTLQQKKQYPLIIATPDEKQGITTLYIGKEANSFEFN